MIISIIGTNGLLANEIGLFGNKNKIDVISYGRREPSIHTYKEFNKINLLTDHINIERIAKSDVIIYACGAGIQSNKKDSFESIYSLNTYTPINICKSLNDIGYQGTFVSFGSCFEIGNNSKPIKFTENDIVNSCLEVPNDYCISKRLLTKFVASAKHSFRHLHLILPTIYGENEAAHRLIPYTVSCIKNNDEMQFTSGKQIRQYLYAGDVPAIILKLVKLKIEGIYNLPGVQTYTVRAIVEEIYKFYGLGIYDELFGKAERSDLGMQNLQLNGKLIEAIVSDFKYTTLIEALKFYHRCF